MDLKPICSGLRVIELATSPGAEFTGRLLAEMGADVLKLEPAGGACSRSVGPFVQGIEDGEHSLHFWFYNGNKQSAQLDLGTPAGLEGLDGLLAEADILICDMQPRELAAAGLSLTALIERHPRLIVASITPFGLSGPWADYKSSDLIALAAGGPLASCGYDDHAIPPIRPGGNQAYHTVAAFAQIGILLALIERQNSGRGDLVDVSMHEALAVTVEFANPYWSYAGALVQRQTCRHAQPEATQPILFRTADDRYVIYILVVADPAAWSALLGWLDSHGFAGELTSDAWQDAAYRQRHFDVVQSMVETFFCLHDADTIYREGQQWGLPIGIVNGPEDLLNDPHLKERDFFQMVEHEGIGAVPYPGHPFRFSAFPGAPLRPAPRLGDANALLPAASSGRTGQ